MAMWQGTELNETTHLWKMYEEGIDYQIKSGLRFNIPKYIDFFEGRQWPFPTENTKNLPRPVVNIVKMICRSKKSSILSTPVKILYKSYMKNKDTDKLNSFAESILKELNQEGLDRLAIDDGIKKGSYFFHYYWDKNAQGLSGRTEGGVRCEIIDPLNIFFQNPSELDEQKQGWILISTPLELEKIKSLADEGCNLSALTPDKSDGHFTIEEANSKGSTYGKNQQSQGTATLLTRYFKVDGEVWCERCTKYSQIQKPFRLTPDKEALKQLIYKDSLQINKNEEKEVSKTKKCGYLETLVSKNTPKASLYPVVCGYYERKEGSIYGISEVEGLIPNQKAINFNIAMTLLNSQQCAWGKYVALPNALKGQTVTNSPGQVLIDYSGTGNGIKRMKDEGVSEIPMSIVQAITELTKTASGTNEILSSESLNTNLSGVAIAQLQAQAEVPIEELRATFWEAKKKQGLVLAQFIRLYYYDKEFIRKTRDEQGRECEICDHFHSQDYEDCIFDVVVEATKGSRSAIASDVSLLDSCLKNGSISFETYIKAYPEGALSNKTSILNQINKEKEEEIYKLRKELEKYKKSKTVDPVSII